MRLRFFALLCFALPLFFASTIIAQTSNSISARPAKIQGVVYDPQGRVVPGASVSLLSAMVAVGDTQTNSKGEYRFDGLLAGTFTIAANAPGFTALLQQISVASGETRTADLQLALTAVQDRVVVSASLGGALAPQTGSSVTVVTQQEIQNEGADTLADALRNVPGVAINRTGQLGAVTSAFIRGGNSNYDLIMVDGIPMNDFGGGFDLAPLPVDGVQSVEVMRGPESALYGENAVAGVINVISEPGEGTPHFSFLGEGGSYDTWRIATSGAGLTHGLSWSYSLARLSTQGPVAYDTYRNQSSFVSLGYSRSARRQFNIHFFGDARRDVNPGPWGSDPDALYPTTPAGQPDFAAAATSLKQDLFGYQASYTERFSSRFQQVTTVSAATDQFSFPSEFGNSFTKNVRIIANTRSEIAVSAKDSLVAGFEFDRDTYEDTYVTDASEVPFTLPRDTYAFFAENRWEAGNRWFLSTGVRVDNIRTGDLPPDETDAGRPPIPASSITQLDPRISVAYLARESSDGFFGATRIHGSFGTGIRPPDGFELGFTDNPQLKPEKNISFDSGVEQRFWGDKAALDTTFFYNRYKDQIVTLGGSFANLSTFSSANIANSRAYGLEESLRLHPARSLEVAAEYTWLNTAILALNGSTSDVALPFSVGQQLIRRPRSSAGYDVTWTHKRLMLNSNASIRGAVLDLEPNLGSYACTLGLQCLFWSRGYVDANAGFAYQLPRGVEIYGRLNNLANQRYEEAFGYPALRLNFVSGIKFNFPAESSGTGR
ncbi:MAG TPA: TonB-dependent receptor [Candidatus Acidoferrales bacterium]|jgi:outer membrane receptor protein involved in Fe transport|nr:TonB-dependent receptor [Candidatus Acidoferrales bacterium]